MRCYKIEMANEGMENARRHFHTSHTGPRRDNHDQEISPNTPWLVSSSTNSCCCLEARIHFRRKHRAILPS